MIYILYIHDKPVIWSSRIEVIDANIAALGSLAKWCRVEPERVNHMTMIVACIVTAGLIWVAIDQLISFLGG
jgi:hypothetical protein